MSSSQSDKIKEIAEALVVCGHVTLDEQASALGISRSTTWTILTNKHKAPGLTAAVVNQMLMSAELPPLVRTKLFEYIEEKIAGSYGHSPQQVHRFVARLTAERLRYHRTRANERSHTKPADPLWVNSPKPTGTSRQ